MTSKLNDPFAMNGVPIRLLPMLEAAGPFESSSREHAVEFVRQVKSELSHEDFNDFVELFRGFKWQNMSEEESQVTLRTERRLWARAPARQPAQLGLSQVGGTGCWPLLCAN